MSYVKGRNGRRFWVSPSQAQVAGVVVFVGALVGLVVIGFALVGMARAGVL